MTEFKKCNIVSNIKGIKVTELSNGYSVDKNNEAFPLGFFESRLEAEHFANAYRLTVK